VVEGVNPADRETLTRTGQGGREDITFDFAADGPGVGSETDADVARDVAKEDAHQNATTAADGHTVGVTFIVVLFLYHFAFDDFDVMARGAPRIDARVADGDEAHLDGDEAAVNLSAFECEIRVGLAAEERELFGFWIVPTTP
jgi:hypothetical protein